MVAPPCFNFELNIGLRLVAINRDVFVVAVHRGDIDGAESGEMFFDAGADGVLVTGFNTGCIAVFFWQPEIETISRHNASAIYFSIHANVLSRLLASDFSTISTPGTAQKLFRGFSADQDENKIIGQFRGSAIHIDEHGLRANAHDVGFAKNPQPFGIFGRLQLLAIAFAHAIEYLAAIAKRDVVSPVAAQRQRGFHGRISAAGNEDILAKIIFRFDQAIGHFVQDLRPARPAYAEIPAYPWPE